MRNNKTRHVILFADASDAEQDLDHKPIIKEMRADNITISVIALGHPSDSDAGFLAEVARLGGGSILFSPSQRTSKTLFNGHNDCLQAGYIVENIGSKSITGLTDLAVPHRFSDR